MAQRAKVTVDLDAREAERKAKALGDSVRSAQDKAEASQKKAGKKDRAQEKRVSKAKGGGKKAGLGTTGAVGALTKVAVPLAAAAALATTAPIIAQVLTSAVIKPVVELILREILPDTYEAQAIASVNQIIDAKVNEAISGFKALANFNEVKAQISAASFAPTVAAFARAGFEIPAKDLPAITRGIVRNTRRAQFLEDQEAQRTNKETIETVLKAITSGLGS